MDDSLNSMPFDWVIEEGSFLFLAGCKPGSMSPWSFEMTEENETNTDEMSKRKGREKKNWFCSYHWNTGPSFSDTQSTLELYNYVN